MCPMGRFLQAMLIKADVDKLVAKLKDMVQKADAEKEVTAAMLKKSARCKAPTCCGLRRTQARDRTIWNTSNPCILWRACCDCACAVAPRRPVSGPSRMLFALAGFVGDNFAKSPCSHRRTSKTA